MWTKLVANKILRKRLGGNNFVADFPIGSEFETPPTTFLQIPSLESSSLCAKSILNQNIHTNEIFVSTWNVGGIAPDEDLAMKDWLEVSTNSYDIYVIGFQEVVPLKAANVLGSENTKICMKWNSLIRETLNGRRSAKGCNNINVNNKNKEEDMDMMDKDSKYSCVISKQMVGILISVWVRSGLRPYIRWPSVSCVGCGIMGCLGNKGSVSVRFELHETSFCFVCTHLASGGREGDERCRTSNVAEILSRTIFPRGPFLTLPRKILDHDRVVLLGDLNCRISLPEATTRQLVDSKDWDSLLQNDQLRMELMNGQVLKGWHEGMIKFAPTYKYIPNSDLYYGCFQKGDKKRAPAWCDRIIWFGNGLKQHTYTRGESKLSDHRPVKAIFTAEVAISRTLRSLSSFFLSERLDRITTQIEASTRNDISNKARSSFQI